ncbi:MAG TPA: helix-hairpin-helix domain-containing protein [Polyangiales bacterium]|nr:helix-hairpin-helix domain-containing protein [Polyangiales bacterium]
MRRTADAAGVKATPSQCACGLIVAALSVVALASGRDPERAGGAARANAPTLAQRAPVRPPSAAGVRALRDGESIDLNCAAAGDLQLLPGVGPKLAERIVAERTKRGGYAKVDDLRAVKGIGPATFARMQRFVRVTGRAATSH